jgi:predicted transcriptional regulator
MPSMWDPAGRRSSIQIVGDMLDLIRLGEPSKTVIMCRVNMSYTQIQRYLTWLKQSGVLETVVADDNSMSYRITPKGLKLLSTLKHLQEMLKRNETNFRSDLLSQKVEIKNQS